MRWAEHVTHMQKRNACRVVEGKPEGKNGILTLNGKVILKWMLSRMCVDWTNVAHNTGKWQVVVNTAMNLQVT
jgi:hypothetical protein